MYIFFSVLLIVMLSAAIKEEITILLDTPPHDRACKKVLSKRIKTFYKMASNVNRPTMRDLQ